MTVKDVYLANPFSFPFEYVLSMQKVLNVLGRYKTRDGTGIILPIMKHRLGVSIAEKLCIGRELEITLSSPPHV